uniref:RRM domain-containing protein n=1 Tax=Monodon monoceros TaxID=40151 RepID=A0A8C6AYU7_MONMO
MSIPISQFIPPLPPPPRRFPPLVSIHFFSTSVSQFLPCKPVHLYHFLGSTYIASLNLSLVFPWQDAAAAIDNMNESELFGRTIRVNLAKPMRIKEGSSRPVWSDDDWLKKFSGKTLEENKEEEGSEPPKVETQEVRLKAGTSHRRLRFLGFYGNLRTYIQKQRE